MEKGRNYCDSSSSYPWQMEKGRNRFHRRFRGQIMPTTNDLVIEIYIIHNAIVLLAKK